MAHIGPENLGIGGPLDGHAGSGSVQAHRADHGSRLPIAVRSAGMNALALWENVCGTTEQERPDIARASFYISGTILSRSVRPKIKVCAPYGHSKNWRGSAANGLADYM
jgi:hypothetical protein